MKLTDWIQLLGAITALIVALLPLIEREFFCPSARLFCRIRSDLFPPHRAGIWPSLSALR